MIPLLKGGEPIRATYWNTLFAELDAKVTAVLDDKSPLMLGTFILTAGADVPMGKCFWFNPGRGVRPRSDQLQPTLGGQSVHGVYDHAPCSDAAADLTLETAVFDVDKKILTFKQPIPDIYRGRVGEAGFFFDESLEAHRRSFVPDDDFFAQAYNTRLTEEQETAFQAWVEAKSVVAGRDLTLDLVNYDLRGFWLNGGEADWSGGHMPDSYKKPNHFSFSDQSIYQRKPDFWDGVWAGGHWTGDAAFKVTSSMLKLHSHADIAAYFAAQEPGVSLSFEEDPGAMPLPSFWLMEPGAYHPERYSSYGLVELIVEGLDRLDVPVEWNKYRFFRVHNLGPDELDLRFLSNKQIPGQPDIYGCEIKVPPFACRCVRKSDSDFYIQGFNYFPKFQEGDPTWLQWPLDRSTPDGTRGANTVISPALVYQWIWEMNRTAAVGGDLPRFWVDPHQLYDVGPLYRPYFAT